MFCYRYYNQYVDKDALLYLILANEILHVLHPNIITIAEDVNKVFKVDLMNTNAMSLPYLLPLDCCKMVAINF